jgi:Ca-activated chloride channel family protein
MEFVSLFPLLWLVPILAVLGMAWRYSLVDRPGALKIASFALRVLAVVLFLLALCRPFVKDRGKEAHVVFLVDVSESVDLASAAAVVPEIKAGIEALAPGDTWSLFRFGDGVRPHETTEDLAKLLETWGKGVADDRFRDATRLGDALLGVRMAFPAGKARRLVVFSDGQETGPRDELDAALATLATEEVEVRFSPIEGIRDAEAAVVALESSTPFAYEGEMIRLQVTVASNTAMKARLRLVNRGVVARESQVTLEARPDNRFPVDVAMGTSGPGLWTAELIPEKDRFPVNNQLATIIEVKGSPKVLFLHRDPKELRPLARALREQEIEAEIRAGTGLPESIAEMLAFDAIVLADVPATELTMRQMEMLRSYVGDFGGGLAMMGSDNSFGLGGYYKTPVEEVLPLVSRFEKEKEKPSLAMVLVIDKSGSMEGEPIALARQAAKATVELIGPRDQIAVVGFDGQAQIICEMRTGAERASVEAAIDSLEAGGGTDVYPAMVTGREMLETSGTQLKHMIILSDGQTQPADHIGLTQAMADGGITVSTVALGGGAAKELMVAIAETGKGRYYETLDPTSVPQIFTKETMQATQSAIKEDLFGVVVTGDHPVLSGYAEEDLPFALGYVMAEAKPTSQVLLAVETGDPLLAISRFGLGTGLAYTSDLSEKWGGEWLAWGDCGQFWAQVFRGILRKSDSEGLTTVSQVGDGSWQVGLSRKDPDGAPVGAIEWEASVLDDQGKTRPVEVEEVGLGRYEARLPAGEAKTLSLRLHDRTSDKLKVLHHAAEYPAEYRLSQELPAVLAALPVYDPAKLRDGEISATRHRNVAHWFAFAGLAAAWGGLLLRRW